MARSKRLTIREVAAAAGVSAQTVSRVLNDRPDVSPETSERVREVIRETGYAPNMLARSLTQGRSYVLGVVAYGLDYFGPSQVVMAIERQAAELGYAIMLNLILHPEREDVDHLLDRLAARRVDGIIWAIPEVGDNRNWLERVPDLPVPAILVGGMDGEPSLPSIAIDNESIGRVATDHLLESEPRHVGIITGPSSWWEARQRLAGWRESMNAHSRPIEKQLMVEGDWTVASGEKAFHALLNACPDIDAVFACNDPMALGFMHAAHTRGMRVPEDVAVVGVDNIPEGSHFWPPLTTVDQPLARAGALAVQKVDEAISGASDLRAAAAGLGPEKTLLEPTLIVRASSRARVAAAK